MGCIHTSQGLESDYVGVIIGKDLRYQNGVVITDSSVHPRRDVSFKDSSNHNCSAEMAEKFPLSPCFFYYGFANNVKSPFSRKLLLFCWDCLRTKPLPLHNREQSRPYQRRFFRASCLS